MSGKSVPVANRLAQMKPRAASPAGTTSCSAQVDVAPTILSRGTPTWAVSFRAAEVMTPKVRRMTQSGWATLTRSQVAFWSSPGGGIARCCTAKPYWAAWWSRMGEGFPAKGRVVVDMGDFQTLELVHAAGPLGDEPDLGRVLTPPVGRGVEDIWEHPPIRGVRAPSAHCEQEDLVVRHTLSEGIGERGAEWMKRRRPRGPFGFQALVALHAAVDVEDGFALFPDQWHAVDAAIARIEEGQIGNVAIDTWDKKKPLAPLADAEHGKKLFARRRHRRHAHQPTEPDGHEPAPPL